MPDLQITPDLLASPHRFLWHPASQTAILSDLHLGHLGTPTNPLFPHLLARHPAHLIIAGDLFDSPNPSASTLQLAQHLLSQLPCPITITITPGNHDPQNLQTLLPNCRIQPSITLTTHLISHGHQLPDDLLSHPSKTWIVGHQHPAVTLTTKTHSAKMPCFALCQTPHNQTLLLPAFSNTPGGPLGTNLLYPHHWLLPTPRPPNQKIQILGIIDSPTSPSQLLNFGPLSNLSL